MDDWKTQNRGYEQAIEDFEACTKKGVEDLQVVLNAEETRLMEIFKAASIHGMKDLLKKRRGTELPQEKTQEEGEKPPIEAKEVDPGFLDGLSEFFDEGKFVDKEILPKWKEIFELCAERGIPVLFSIVKSKDAEKSAAATGMIIPSNRTPLKMQIIGHFLAEDPGNEPEAATKAAILAALGGLNSPGAGRGNGCNCPVCKAERQQDEDKPN